MRVRVRVCMCVCVYVCVLLFLSFTDSHVIDSYTTNCHPIRMVCVEVKDRACNSELDGSFIGSPSFLFIDNLAGGDAECAETWHTHSRLEV